MSWESDISYTSQLTFKDAVVERLVMKTLFFIQDEDREFDCSFLDADEVTFQGSLGSAYFDPKFSKYLATKLVEELRFGIRHAYMDEWHCRQIYLYYGDEIIDENFSEYFDKNCKNVFKVSDEEVFSIICRNSVERIGYIYSKHIESSLGGEPWSIGAAKFKARGSKWYRLEPEIRSFSRIEKIYSSKKSQICRLHSINSNSYAIKVPHQIAKLFSSFGNKMVICARNGKYYTIKMEESKNSQDDWITLRWRGGAHARHFDSFESLVVDKVEKKSEFDEIFWPPRIFQYGSLEIFPIEEFIFTALSHNIRNRIKNDKSINEEMIIDSIKSEKSWFERMPILEFGLEYEDDRGNQMNSRRQVWFRKFSPTLHELTIPGYGNTNSDNVRDGKIRGKWQLIPNRVGESERRAIREYGKIRRYVDRELRAMDPNLLMAAQPAEVV